MHAEIESRTDTRILRPRARPILPLFLVGSVAVHAAVLVILAPLEFEPAPARPGALEVVILQPRPLPMAPPEPEPQIEEAPKPPPRRPAAKALPSHRPDAAPLALPEPQTPMESGSVVPAPRLADPPAGAGQKTQVGSVTPPAVGAAYLRNPAPRYPLAARRAGEQGTVTLRVLVTREGLPARVELEKSSGSAHLDAAAMEAVKGWRFSPARRDAEAVEGAVLVPIVFRLENPS